MSSFDEKKIGIVGATGAVGIEIVKVLDKRNFPISHLYLFASERSAGSTLDIKVANVTLPKIAKFELEKVNELDIVFLAVSGTFALKYAKLIKGPIVIDNSSAFRQDSNVPLIIPEINGEAGRHAKLIANPNCTTAIAAMVLWPIYCHYGIEKMIVSTYQAASGAGIQGMDELKNGSQAVLDEKDAEVKVFAHPLAFNVIPRIDAVQENRYTKEEMKVVWETRKIFQDSSMAISCTAVRTPTMRAHAESITIVTSVPIDAEEARNQLCISPGVRVVDEPGNDLYPMPLNASEQDDVQVGRIRQNLIYGKYGLDLFVCGDQLLRGAALNAVLIAEYVSKPQPVRPYAFTQKRRRKYHVKVDAQSAIFGGLMTLSLGLLTQFAICSYTKHHR